MCARHPSEVAGHIYKPHHQRPCQPVKSAMGNNNSLPIINSHVCIVPLTLMYLIHISSPHPRCCLLPRPINISSGGGISAMIPIHHPQSEHICSSWLVFPNFPFLLELTTLQGDEDPNVLSSLKAPQTKPHLKRKRDPHDDSTDPPPVKRMPMITSVSFSGFPSSHLSSQL